MGLLEMDDPLAKYGNSSIASNASSEAHDSRFTPRFLLGDDEGYYILGSGGRRSQGVHGV